ncbi:hypothetical protein CPC16_009746 [Podila verticillata]|nr:hypothetical protein CPC16_009746 [Podila verticillata]
MCVGCGTQGQKPEEQTFDSQVRLNAAGTVAEISGSGSDPYAWKDLHVLNEGYREYKDVSVIISGDSEALKVSVRRPKKKK